MSDLAVKGFKAAGVCAGIKKRDRKDLGLIFSEVPASVAGVFTRNRVQAAPVRLTRERSASGTCRAIVVNSGNANCCTGEQGMVDAVAMARATAESLGVAEDSVLVASTGVIGEPLPVQRIEAAIPELSGALDERGFRALAETMMTTDTVPKTASRTSDVHGKPFSVVGVAKGAGMIRPDLATMLCFVCTDLEVSPEILKKALAAAADQSFNRITVDGDTSTNDTLLVMANGRSGAAVRSADQENRFRKVLDDILLDLAKQLVRDGEGVTKLVELHVRGALSDEDACKIAETIGHSPLVKTAFFGEDANWGRILAAAGRAGADLDPDRIDVYFDGVQMVQAGMGRGKGVEAEATRVLKKPEFTVTVDLNIGRGSASMLTCDFSVDYVKINADYRS